MGSRKRVLALLAGSVLLIWSAVFAPTFRYPFFWDDYHCIRQYSMPELLSTFHGWDDPDKMETPALRPIVATLFAFQSAAFGENVVLHRVFLTALMWTLLFAAGLLLTELGCSTMQIALVFALFVFSRAFATVNLWIILSSLVLSYTLMTVTLLLFVRWVKTGRIIPFGLMIATVLLAMFTREEAYILCAAAMIIWALVPHYRSLWKRAAVGAAALVSATAVHVILRRIFVPEAPAPRLTAESLEAFWLCVKSSWLPSGQHTVGFIDDAVTNLWIGFLILLLLMFVRLARPIKIWQSLGVCALGLLFCSPSLAVARSYGLTMPTLAFMTAIAIALTEVYGQLQPRTRLRPIPRYSLASVVALGLIIGIGGGIRRSYYVAESLHENCALKILFDATFVFDLTERPTTVPEKRKAAERQRLAAFGIISREDLQNLVERCANYDAEYVRNRNTRTAPFLPRYAYNAY